jgi:lambda family phage portal protein
VAKDRPLSLLDRAIEPFAPSLVARRVAARLTLARLTDMAREYDGAGQGRLTSNWRTKNTSANAEIEAAAPLLRARSRDLVRNSPIAASGVQILVSNLVGTGIRPRASTGDVDLDKRVNDLWAEWSANCDFFGHTDFHGLLALAVRLMIEGGDSLTLRRVARQSTAIVPLQLEVKEVDHLDDNKLESTAVGGARISQGIEFDAQGRRAAYWLYPDHPGDLRRDFRNSLKSVRVPASQVVHLFERQRVQDRGVPWLAPVIRALRDIDDYQRAELVRKKTEACMVGVVLGEPSDSELAPKVTLGDGSVAQEFGPGMIAFANGATDVRFNQPSAVGGVYEWHRTHLHIMAAGLRMPYALLTGDLSQANFSSSRVGLNEFHRFIEMTQWGLIIPRFCQPVWDWFIESAYLAGLIPVDRVRVEWAPPKFESVNPKQDAEADLIEVRAGFASVPQMIAKRGHDPAQVIEEQAEHLAATNAKALVLDSDPSRVTKAGLMQSDSSATQE